MPRARCMPYARRMRCHSYEELDQLRHSNSASLAMSDFEDPSCSTASSRASSPDDARAGLSRAFRYPRSPSEPTHARTPARTHARARAPTHTHTHTRGPRQPPRCNASCAARRQRWNERTESLLSWLLRGAVARMGSSMASARKRRKAFTGQRAFVRRFPLVAPHRARCWRHWPSGLSGQRSASGADRIARHSHRSVHC